MSKFEELQTEIRSTRFLGEALSIIGHAPEMHPDGVTIKDYYGKAHPQQVVVLVRKTGSFLSDFGFAKTRGRPPGARGGRSRPRVSTRPAVDGTAASDLQGAGDDCDGEGKRVRISRSGSDADRRRPSDSAPVCGSLAGPGGDGGCVDMRSGRY